MLWPLLGGQENGVATVLFLGKLIHANLYSENLYERNLGAGGKKVSVSRKVGLDWIYLAEDWVQWGQLSTL